MGVNPANTLSDISTSLSGLLADSGDQFVSIASEFGSAFESTEELFTSIADRITLSLNANFNVEASLELSVEAISFSTKINELKSDLLAVIVDAFDVTIVETLHITASVQLRLQAESTNSPLDPSTLEELLFSGDFEGVVNVALDYVPSEISLRAYSPFLTDAETLEFEAALDIDLLPIQESKCTAQCPLLAL